MGQKSSFFTTNHLLISGYLLISLVFIGVLLRTLLKIYRIKRNYPNTEVEGINFINTNAKGTPFSFFNSIFWNRSIDLHSSRGQQIFNHELAHIKQKHTHDKIFMNVALLFFWINPFFWIIRKELNMIHEFVADKMALEDGDINAFAEMILSSVYPGKQFSIANSFFYSPIKRRLMMLSKNTNSKVNYVSRLLVLPLAAIIFFAFSLKMKKAEVGSIYNGKQITVIIDAGHGGADGGAREGNLNEKDLNLAIAQQVKKLNDNKNIRILLTRNNDQEVALKDRVQFAKDNDADLFISIHLDESIKRNESKFTGLNIIIPKDDNPFLSQSKLLGSAVMEEFKKNYTLSMRSELLQPRLTRYVLKENQYPAITITPANISVEKDLAYITKLENQEIVARNILRGIENYAQNNSNAVESKLNPVTDTIPAKEIASYEVIKKDNKVIITYTDKSKETLNREDAQKRGIVFPPTPPTPPTPPDPLMFKVMPESALFILNGKEVNKQTIEQIAPSDIASITVLKKDGAMRYGEKGRDGVVEVTTINADQNQNVHIYPRDSSIKIREIEGEAVTTKKDPEKVFTKVEHPATFPGGASKWAQYIQKAIMENISDFGDEDYGTCIVKFIVDENGKVSDVEATTMKGTHLAQTAVNAIRRGPNWVPATQNGHKVNAYRLQPVTLTNPKATGDNIPGKILEKMEQATGATEPDKVFIKVDQPATFPGGPAKWAPYIQKAISEKISDFGDEDYGTCIVKFIVNENGKVSNVEATTMKGTSLAGAAVSAIRRGPNWVPATQNGHKVNAYTFQPVTLTNPDK